MSLQRVIAGTCYCHERSFNAGRVVPKRIVTYSFRWCSTSCSRVPRPPFSEPWKLHSAMLQGPMEKSRSIIHKMHVLERSFRPGLNIQRAIPTARPIPVDFVSPRVLPNIPWPMPTPLASTTGPAFHTHTDPHLPHLVVPPHLVSPRPIARSDTQRFLGLQSARYASRSVEPLLLRSLRAGSIDRIADDETSR